MSLTRSEKMLHSICVDELAALRIQREQRAREAIKCVPPSAFPQDSPAGRHGFYHMYGDITKIMPIAAALATINGVAYRVALSSGVSGFRDTRRGWWLVAMRFDNNDYRSMYGGNTHGCAYPNGWWVLSDITYEEL